jgi:hypothetical protein
MFINRKYLSKSTFLIGFYELTKPPEIVAPDPDTAAMLTSNGNDSYGFYLQIPHGRVLPWLPDCPIHQGEQECFSAFYERSIVTVWNRRTGERLFENTGAANPGYSLAALSKVRMAS